MAGSHNLDFTCLPITLPRYIEAYTGTCEAGACNAEDAEKTVKAVEDDVIASFGVRLDTKSQDVVRGLVRCWWNEVRQSRQQAWVAHTKHADVDGEGQGVEHEMEAPVLSNMNEAAQQEAERGPGGQGKAEDEAAVQAQKKMEEAADADTGQFNGKSPDLQTSEKLQTKGFAAKPQVEGAVVAQSDGLPALKLKGKAQAMGGERADTAQPNSKACSPKGNRKGKSGKAQGQVKRPRNEGDEEAGGPEEEPDADGEAEAEGEGKVQAAKVDEAQCNRERVVTRDEGVKAKDQRRSARAGAEEGAGRPKVQKKKVHGAEANAQRADTGSKGKAVAAKAEPETGAPCGEQDGDVKDVVPKRRRRMLTVGVVLGGVLRVSVVKGSERRVKMHACTSTLCSRPGSTQDKPPPGCTCAWCASCACTAFTRP